MYPLLYDNKLSLGQYTININKIPDLIVKQDFAWDTILVALITSALTAFIAYYSVKKNNQLMRTQIRLTANKEWEKQLITSVSLFSSEFTFCFEYLAGVYCDCIATNSDEKLRRVRDDLISKTKNIEKLKIELGLILEVGNKNTMIILSSCLEMIKLMTLLKKEYNHMIKNLKLTPKQKKEIFKKKCFYFSEEINKLNAVLVSAARELVVANNNY